MRNIIKLIIFTFLLNLPHPLKAQSIFEKYYDKNDDDGEFVVQTADGGYMVVGTTEYSNDTSRIWIFKTDAAGNMLWEKIYGEDQISESNDIAVTSDGGLVISAFAGHNTWPFFYYTLIIRTDNQGDTLWTKRYYTNFSREICTTSNDEILLVSHELDTTSQDINIKLFKMDANGDSLWQAFVPYPLVQYVDGVQRTFDGGFIITGSHQLTQGGGPGQDTTEVLLAKVDSMGTTSWIKTLRMDQYAEGNYVIQTPDSNFVVCGYSDSQTSENLLLVKFNTLGDSIWTRRINYGFYSISGYVVDHCFDNGYLITGYAADSIGDYLFVARTNAQGDTLWTHMDQDVVHGNFIQQTADSGFIVVGGGIDPSGGVDGDIYVLKGGLNGQITALNSWSIGRDEISVYPNPSTGLIYVDDIEFFEKTGFIISDIFGHEIQRGLFNGVSPFAVEIKGMSGVYLIKIFNSKQEWTFKIVKY